MPTEAGKDKEGFFPKAFGGSMALLISDTLILDFQPLELCMKE